MRMNPFDRDGFDKPTRSDKPPHEHFAHTPRRETLEDLVTTESLRDLVGIGRHAAPKATPGDGAAEASNAIKNVFLP
jgi:hypothetical protein